MRCNYVFLFLFFEANMRIISEDFIKIIGSFAFAANCYRNLYLNEHYN